MVVLHICLDINVPKGFICPIITGSGRISFSELDYKHVSIKTLIVYVL